MPQPTDTAPPHPPQPSQDPVRRSRARFAGVLVASAIVLLIGVAAGLYGMRSRGKEGPAACVGTAATIARIDPLVHGEVAALGLSRPPLLLPDLAFQSQDGATTTLADFRGKTVLLNLWATWCVPCRKEMPALDRLQAKLGGPDFQVVAVNIDTAKLDRPRQFLAEVGATALPFYADPTARVFQTLRQDASVLGLPTTFLIDRNGCTLGAMAGPADWSSADAATLIAAAKS